MYTDSVEHCVALPAIGRSAQLRPRCGWLAHGNGHIFLITSSIRDMTVEGEAIIGGPDHPLVMGGPCVTLRASLSLRAPFHSRTRLKSPPESHASTNDAASRGKISRSSRVDGPMSSGMRGLARQDEIDAVRAAPVTGPTRCGNLRRSGPARRTGGKPTDATLSASTSTHARDRNGPGRLLEMVRRAAEHGHVLGSCRPPVQDQKNIGPRRIGSPSPAQHKLDDVTAKFPDASSTTTRDTDMDNHSALSRASSSADETIYPTPGPQRSLEALWGPHGGHGPAAAPRPP